MIPMVYPWCHSTISNQKTSKRKVVLKADIRWRLRIRTFDEPERRCREVREVMKKRGFLERRPPGSPEKEHEKWASREPKARPGGPIRLKRRRATLPHPLECSTIAAPGLSYRVRNGTGRLTRAMTTANLTATARKPKESKPACHRWRSGNRLADARQSLPLYRSVTIPTHIAVQDDPAQERRGTNHHVIGMLCRRRPLVPVGSTPHGASTSGLSNTCSTCGLQRFETVRNPNLGAGFPLRCFQRLSLPNVANRPCRWRDNRHTRGSSTQVLSYYGQASSAFQRAQRIETKLSHDVLNPARVPL